MIVGEQKAKNHRQTFKCELVGTQNRELNCIGTKNPPITYLLKYSPSTIFAHIYSHLI